MALTQQQLDLLVSPGQWSLRYLMIRKPNTIYTAVLDDLPASNDGVAEVTYVTGSGTVASILPGMTLLVGTTAGARDLGIARIRKAATVDTLYIGEQSEIHWSASCYLTVVDNYLPWVKPQHLAEDGSWLVDYDIVYTDQHNTFNPVPVMGGPRVARLVGTTVDVAFDASASYVIDSTIASHSWSAPGSSAISGGSTATPTITYNAVGHYAVYDEVTAANGKTTKGVRYVFVWSTSVPPITAFTLDGYRISYDTGGWEARITAHGQFAMSDVEPNAYTVLFARDFFGGVEATCPGELTGQENILMCGWIDEEGIELDYEKSSVSFVLRGLTAWMKKLPNFPIGIENTTDASTNWMNMQHLTVDKMLFHCLYWQSTIMSITDCFLTNDTKYAVFFKEQLGQFWDQLYAVSYKTIFAMPGVDKYGRLHFCVEPQLIPLDERSSVPSLQTLEDKYRQEEVSFKGTSATQCAMIAASGVATDIDNVPTPYLSNAPGNVMAHWGSVDPEDNLLVAGQDNLNEIVGLLYAWRNNPYSPITLKMVGNYRVLDVFPTRKMQLTITDDVNIRGVQFTVDIFPREISCTVTDGDFIEYDVSFEVFTVAAFNGITQPVPVVPEEEPEEGDYGIPDIVWPGNPILPPTYTWPINNPAVDLVLGPYLRRVRNIVAVNAYIYGDEGSSVKFNIEYRNVFDVAGTDIKSTEMEVIDSEALEVLTFDHSQIPTNNWIVVDISEVNGDVSKLVITLSTQGY